MLPWCVFCVSFSSTISRDHSSSDAKTGCGVTCPDSWRSSVRRSSASFRRRLCCRLIWQTWSQRGTRETLRRSGSLSRYVIRQYSICLSTYRTGKSPVECIPPWGHQLPVVYLYIIIAYYYIGCLFLFLLYLSVISKFKEPNCPHVTVWFLNLFIMDK